MAAGAGRYANALDALRNYGLASFTQTGGMCAALGVQLERGYLLVTDADDDLPWEPERLRRWGVGFYRRDDVSDGPETFVAVDDPIMIKLHLDRRPLVEPAGSVRRASGPRSLTSRRFEPVILGQQASLKHGRIERG